MIYSKNTSYARLCGSFTSGKIQDDMNDENNYNTSNILLWLLATSLETIWVDLGLAFGMLLREYVGYTLGY